MNRFIAIDPETQEIDEATRFVLVEKAKSEYESILWGFWCDLRYSNTDDELI